LEIFQFFFSPLQHLVARMVCSSFMCIPQNLLWKVGPWLCGIGRWGIWLPYVFFSPCPLTHADLLSFHFSLTPLNLLLPAKVAIRFIIGHQD
jgi:hypothetical protein